MNIKNKIAVITTAIVVGGTGVYKGTEPNVPVDTVLQNEVISKRTENSITVDLGNGMYQSTVYSCKVNYIDEDSTYKTIDTEVKPKPFLVYAANKLTGGKLYEVVSGTYHTEFPEEKEYNYKFTRNGASIEYEATFDTTSMVDITIKSLTTGIKEYVVLKDKTAPQSLTWKVITDGMLVDSGYGGWKVLNQSQEKAFYISAFTATDAELKSIKVTGIYNDKENTITAVVDCENASFPVTVDPATSTYEAVNDGSLETINATYLTARNATTATNLKSDYIWVGQDSTTDGYHVYRGFLQFPITTENFFTVTACTLWVLGAENHTGSDVGINIISAKAYRPTLTTTDFNKFDQWVSSGAYFNYPLAPQWDTGDFSGNPSISNKMIFLPAGIDTVEATHPDTLAVALLSGQDINGNAPDGGETMAHEYVAFYNSSSEYPPYLSITYSISQVPSTFILDPDSTTTITATWDDRAQDETGYSIVDAYYGDYDYCETLTIDHDRIDATLTNFPVMVKLTSANFDFGHAQTDGDDIWFMSGADTLDFDREDTDLTDSTAVFWVEVPSISNTTDTEIKMYFGKSTAASLENTHGVWDSNFKMVQHLNDSTTSLTADATINANKGSKKGANEPIEAAGKIGKAQSFDGTDDNIVIANESNFDITNYLTISAWVYKADWTTGNINKGIVSKSYDAYELNILNGSPCFQVNRDATDRRAISPVLSAGWHHIVFRFDKDNQNANGEYHSLIVDGTLQTLTWVNGSDTNTALATNNTAPNIGSRATAALFADNIVDEVRVSNVARSNAWIKAEYYSDMDSLLTYGAETNLVYDTAAASATTKQLTGLSVNTKYALGIRVDGGVLDRQLCTVKDSAYTFPNVPSAPTLSNPTTDSLKIVINVNSNPAWTKFLNFATTSTAGDTFAFNRYSNVMREITPFFVNNDSINATIALNDSFWATYANHGGSSGKTYKSNVGQTYTVKTLAKSGE